MRSFSTLSLTGSQLRSLIWRQPKFSQDFYELVDDPTGNSQAGEALYATIGWPKWLSNQAVTHNAFGVWYFDQLGWTRRTIQVTRPIEASEDSSSATRPTHKRLATFEVGLFWEGDFTLSSGEIFHWYRTNILHNAWAMTEVLPPVHSQTAEMELQGKPVRNERKHNFFRFGKRPKPPRRELLVYEIEFGMRWFKQEAWINLPVHQVVNIAELTFLLCLGMYLGYCFNQNVAAAVAVSSTATVS